MKTSTRQGLIYAGVLIAGGAIGYAGSQYQARGLKAEIESLTNEVAEQQLQSNSALLKAKIDSDTAISASKAAAAKALTEQKDQAEAALAAANAEATATANRLQADIKKISKQLSDQKSVNANLESQIADLEAKTAALEEKSAGQTEQNNSLTEKLGEIEATLAATQAKASETENQLQSDLDETTKLLSEQRSENANLRKQGAELESQVLALTVAKVNAEAMTSALKGQLTSLTSEALTKAEATAIDFSKLRTDLEQARQSLSDEIEKSNRLENRISALEEELDRAKRAASN